MIVWWDGALVQWVVGWSGGAVPRSGDTPTWSMTAQIRRIPSRAMSSLLASSRDRIASTPQQVLSDSMCRGLSTMRCRISWTLFTDEGACRVWVVEELREGVGGVPLVAGRSGSYEGGGGGRHGGAAIGGNTASGAAMLPRTPLRVSGYVMAPAGRVVAQL